MLFPYSLACAVSLPSHALQSSSTSPLHAWVYDGHCSRLLVHHAAISPRFCVVQERPYMCTQASHGVDAAQYMRGPTPTKHGVFTIVTTRTWMIRYRRRRRRMYSGIALHASTHCPHKPCSRARHLPSMRGCTTAIIEAPSSSLPVSPSFLTLDRGINPSLGRSDLPDLSKRVPPWTRKP